MPKRTKQLKMLEDTLLDTEMVLFSPVVEKAVKHYGMVEPKVKHACNDFLIKRKKLMSASKKRPGSE